MWAINYNLYLILNGRNLHYVIHVQTSTNLLAITGERPISRLPNSSSAKIPIRNNA